MLAFAACGGGGGGASKGEIEIWSSLPRQGSSKAQTDTIVNAINMAIEEKGGTVGGYTIKYVDKDDSTAAAGKWDEATEIKNANDAVANDKLVAYIGTFNSGAAKLSDPDPVRQGHRHDQPGQHGRRPHQAVRGGRAGQVLPERVQEELHARHPQRLAPGECRRASGRLQLGLKNVYILDDTEVYGKGIADVFNTRSADYGLTVLGRDGIDGKATDYKALAEKVKATNPDLVYYGGITQNNAGQLWRDLRDAMPDVALMGPDGIYENEFLEAAAAAAEGSYITFGGVPPDQLTGKGKEFVDKYTAKYPNNPVEGYTAYGYEAAQRRPRSHRAGCRQEPRRRPGAPRPRPRRGQGDEGLRRRARQVELRCRRRYKRDHYVGSDHHQRRVQVRLRHRVAPLHRRGSTSRPFGIRRTAGRPSTTSATMRRGRWRS